MNYENFKRDLAVRILRKTDTVIRDENSNAMDLIGAIMEALDEALPTDDSDSRGPTEMVDLACVYEVDCPDCGNHGFDDEYQEYTDVHPYCGNCGYCFN